MLNFSKRLPDTYNMKTTRIAFFDTKPYDKETFNIVNNDFKFEIKYHKYHLTQETAVLAKNYDTVCVFVNDEVNKEVIEQLYEQGTKLIALRCAGYNNVDFKTAYKKLHVVRVPAYSPYAVAEHSVALMLSLNRKIHRAYFRTRDANFSLHGLMGFDMYRKVAGIIGTGKIGKVLIDILLGFGMKVYGYDVYKDPELLTKPNFEYVDLDMLFANSDIISLNCPLTKETEYIINSSSLDKMKDGVMLINTGRGKLIKTADLIEALKNGKVSAAGLDVYEEESEYFFEDRSDAILTDDVLARLLTFNNVIITSHQAFFTKEAMQNIAKTTLQNISDFFNEKPLQNEICYKCNRGSENCLRKATGKCF
jgi:D-lactate dehydrogenase